MRVFFLVAAMALAAPAAAQTASQPSAPVRKDGKTDFTRPFVNDRLVQQAPSNPPPAPHTELNAGPSPINK